MAEETFVLIMLVIVMLVGSYMAGSIPLVMKLSEEKLRFVTILGAGLLVGTALNIIIPEGIRSLYSSSINKMSQQITGNDKSTNPSPQLVSATIASHTGHIDENMEDHSRVIGLSLVLGFIFMMLVDHLSQQKNSSNDSNITATLGLVVHAAADGVALGAAATTSHQDVEIIIFVAIMLHKAPAAFGLVSFLLHEKIERLQIRRHLAIFSISAPLFTLLTYFGIGQEQKETLNSVNATGIAMLFSAGTFLYVATVHVLPELTQQNSSNKHHGQYDYHTLENVEVNVKEANNIGIRQRQTPAQSHNSKGLSCSELTTMICGALLPLIITFSHHH